MLSQFRCDTPSLRVSWHRQDSNLLTGLPNYNPNKLNTMKNSRCALRSVPFASAIFTDHRGKVTNYATLHFAIFLNFRGSRSFRLFGERQ